MLSQINNTEIVEKKVDVEQAISRMRRPLEQTSLNIEVYGVYSLPDAWKSKLVSLFFHKSTFKIYHSLTNKAKFNIHL